MNSASELIQTYYRCFNQQDLQGLSLLSEDGLDEISQGESQTGKNAFRQFLEHLNTCYCKWVFVAIRVNPEGPRAAAEFMLDGECLQTDGGLAEAKGQTSTIRVGALFEIEDGRISRVSNHYNLKDWVAQVSL